MTTATKKKAADPDLKAKFEEAIKSYEAALKSGVQLQEESVKLWKDLLKQTGSPEDFQEKLEAMSKDAIPQVQKRMEDFLKEFLEQSETSMDLFTKALKVYQSTSMDEGSQRMRDLWESSLGALRSNVRTVLNTNSQVMDSMTDIVETYTPKFTR